MRFGAVVAVSVLVVCAACVAGGTTDAPPSVVAGAADRAEAADDSDGCVNDSCALGLAPPGTAAAADARAVTGAPLAVCGVQPLTGFLRDGVCRTGVDDVGAHTVCGIVTAEFLAFSKGRGNDLVTARGGFDGLVPGSRWCLCESRVQEALAAGIRVPIDLSATHTAALRTLTRAQLDGLAATAGAAAPTGEPAHAGRP